ncbi:MAG: radical SAM protein [Defluviitaleaceae bacterium]|nr:radical SAM protein [Defluviitaleaceae bacterium]
MQSLSVAVDMAGCPNRCRHCWLGNHRNGKMTTQELCDIARQFSAYVQELTVHSWWREPDYRDDYRELWALEQELSSPGMAKRFELLSIWRLARDESYASWAANLEPKVCQISFFGMEESTDWGIRRKGAFQDNMLATQRLLEVGIAPRWQLFLTKRNLDDLDEFLRLVYKLDLHKHGEVFIGGISPEGAGYEIEGLRIEENDLALIPKELIDICREGTDLLGQPEYVLLEELMQDNSPPNLTANVHCISINADYDAYPNIAEPTSWWRLGNLKSNGVDAIIKTYLDETTPGMKANREIPISMLARKYGNPNSKKLYHKDDLISRWMHEWGVEQKSII